MRPFLLAFGIVALLASTVSAGPIRERLAARRGAATCSTCSESSAAAATKATVPAVAPAAKQDPVKAAPIVLASSCEGGNCPAPSARRGVFGFRR